MGRWTDGIDKQPIESHHMNHFHSNFSALLIFFMHFIFYHKCIAQGCSLPFINKVMLKCFQRKYVFGSNIRTITMYIKQSIRALYNPLLVLYQSDS